MGVLFRGGSLLPSISADVRAVLTTPSHSAGHFSAMEGGMGGLAGTMDQRIAAHSFYFKFFTATDTLELAQFGAAQITACSDYQNFPNCTRSGNTQQGAINHFDANIYAGVSGTDPLRPITADSEYEDNTYGWLYQLAKAYTQTNNISAVEAQREQIPRAIQHVLSTVKSDTFDFPGPASNTYDDFWELPLDCYVGSMYPMVMHSGAVLATALGNTALAAACSGHAARGGKDFVASLYNGKFFAYGAELNGTGT